MSTAPRVALLCLDPWRLEGSGDHRPFNYAVRRIQAAVLGDPRLSHVEVALLESRSLDADELAARIEAFDPQIVGVSAYVWSFPTLLEVCRRAKAARPDRTVIFGGPSARPEMFELPQHSDGASVVDAIVVGDGEACIQEILLAPARDRATLLSIPGLAVHDGRDWLLSPPRDYGPPDRFPSPYQLGLMPRSVTGQIESFRGCPLSCTYCEWGDTGATPRVFGYEHLVRELEALRELDAKGTWLVDPGLNLSSRAFSNLRRAEAEVGTLAALGSFRCEIYPSRLTDEHLAFLEATRTAYCGIGLQSYDAGVLREVERPFSEARFERVVRDVASIVPDTVVEVILGLPGDDPDGFRRTIERVRRLPVAVRVFHCLVLPSALMKRAPASFELEYDPFTLQVISCRGWSRADLERTCAWLDDEAWNESGEIPHGGTWKFPRPDRPSPDAQRMAERAARAHELTPPEEREEPAVPHELREALRTRVAAAAAFELRQLALLGRDARAGLSLLLEGPSGPVRLRATRAEPEERAYRVVGPVAYSYEARPERPSPDAVRALDPVIAAVHPILEAVIVGVRGGPARAKKSLPLSS